MEKIKTVKGKQRKIVSAGDINQGKVKKMPDPKPFNGRKLDSKNHRVINNKGRSR